MIKNSKPEKIGNILKGIVGEIEAGRKSGEGPADVIKKVIPAQILKHIKIQNKFKGKLIINTEDHNWLYEVSKYKERILKALDDAGGDFKINPAHSNKKSQGTERMGGIKEIFFKVGGIK